MVCLDDCRSGPVTGSANQNEVLLTLCQAPVELKSQLLTLDENIKNISRGSNI
jgi:hypothetical protein